MKYLFTILFLSFFIFQNSFAQNTKNKKNKFSDGRPRVSEVFGDSVRTDSVVYYETVIGYIMPDLSVKFKGTWDINVMRRQARAVPDSFSTASIEFYDDTLFRAYVGCNQVRGYYIIKGPTIKFYVTDSLPLTCSNDIETWFLKLIQERVSYFGIDEKILYLKDGAYNIVFDCSRKKNEIKQ
jgi:heat shock protein HslJ